MMYSRFSPISSLGTVRPSIYARTTGRSSRRSWCAGGWPGCGSRPSTSRRAVRGRNGYNESFNGKLRNEFLNGEIFYTLPEAVVLVEQWRRVYNTVRPHSACGGLPPAPEALKPSPWFLRMPQLQGLPMASGLT